MPVEGRFEIAGPDGSRISFAAGGRGPTTVLLLHGIPGWSGSWGPVAKRLPARLRVLAPDLIGFGQSSTSHDIRRIHARGQAEALLDALDRMGVHEAAVVGHDFGGPIAIWMTKLRPGFVSHLGLVSTNAFPDTPIPFPLSMLKMPVVGDVVERFMMSPTGLRMMLRRGVGTPGVRLSGDEYVGAPGQAAAIREIFAYSLRNLSDLYTPVEEALRQVQLPGFVAWGTADPFFPVAQGQRVAAAIPSATFVVLEAAGHFLPEERPDEVASLIETMVGTYAPAGAGH